MIRLGHVRRITPDRIILDDGEVPTGPGVAHVHCAAPGLPRESAPPVFADGRMTLGIVTRVNISISAAMIARVQVEDLPLDVKNRLCPTPLHPDGLAGYFAMVLSGLGAEFAWREHPGLRSWLEGARLNITRRDPDRGVDPELRKLGRRIGVCVAAAAANLASIKQLLPEPKSSLRCASNPSTLTGVGAGLTMTGSRCTLINSVREFPNES